MRLAVVGPFARGIGVMHIETEARAGSPAGPLEHLQVEHLQVAIRIAERRDRTVADVGLYGDGFTRLVVKEMQLRAASSA